MSDVIALITEVLNVQITTLGTTAITLGLLLGGALVIGLATLFYRRVRGRG